MTFSKSSLLAATMLVAFSGAAYAGPDAIKIGVLNDQSGPYSDLAGKGSVAAAEMAAEDFGGKVLGKPIKILTADHQNKPDVGSSIANSWIDVDNVDAIADVPTSSVALAIQEITKNKDKVHLNVGAGSSSLTGTACSPNAVHWAYDTYALAHGTGTAMVKQGFDSWFFITADYAFGHALENDTAAAVKEAGGKVLGSVNAPFPNTDFSSFLLQAQGSGAKVIGLANAGGDTVNAIKQAKEFGIIAGGQHLAGLLAFVGDIHSLGLDTAQGLIITGSWYWDLNDETRAWSKRWQKKFNTDREPSSIQAGVYSAVTHYLKAVKMAGTDEGRAVVAAMKKIPVDDMFAHHGTVREDGRMVHDMYLFQVKTPAESKYPWDYYKTLRVIPGAEAFRPLDKGNCPLVAAAK